MKTIITLIVGAMAVMSLAGSAFAADKYVDYRAEVDATKGTSAGESMHAWQHLNRFARDNDEKGQLGEVILPAGEKPMTPKNFRNNI